MFSFSLDIRRDRWPSFLEAGAVILFMALAFGLAAWGSASIFDRLPHVEDEVTFLFQAKSVSEGKLIASAPEYPDSFRMPFVIAEDGRWFGKYPPGFPVVLSLGVLAGAPWLVNASAAALAVGLVYLLGRRLYGAVPGLLAAALLVSSPFFILQSSSLLSHVVGLVWTLLALLAFVLARDRPSGWAALGVGVALGALFMTRPLTGVAVGVAIGLFALVDIIRRERSLRLYLPALAGFLPFAVLFLGYNEWTTGDPLKTAYELWWPYDRLGFGDDVGRTGHYPHKALKHARGNLGDLSRMMLGWPRWLSLGLPLLAAVAALAAPVRRALSGGGRPGFSAQMRRQVAAPQVLLRTSLPDRTERLPEIASRTSPGYWDLLLFSVAVCLVLAHMLYWTPGSMYGPRYYFEAIGPLMLLAARGLLIIAGLLDAWLARLALLRKQVVPAGLILVLAVGGGLTVRAASGATPDQFDRFRDWNGITDVDLDRVERAQLDYALVFVERENWMEYAPFFIQNNVTLDGDVVYAIDRGRGDNLKVMRLYPDRTYYRAVDGALARIDASRLGGSGP